jgi:putative addiction module component
MALTKQQIKAAALELDPIEREALAEELLMSISNADSRSIDAAWLEEVKRRDASFIQTRGAAKAVDDVVSRLREYNI